MNYKISGINPVFFAINNILSNKMNKIHKVVILSCLILLALSQKSSQSGFKVGLTSLGSNFASPIASSDYSCCGRNTIKVSGKGSVSGNPDIAIIYVGVEQVADTTSAAIQSLNRKVNSILQIARQNVLAADIASQAINTFPRTKFQNGVSTVTGQVASQLISLKLRNIGTGASIGNLIDRLSAVDGFTVNSIDFELSNRDSLIIAARNNAFNDARTRALDYASFAEVRLGKVINIDDNSFDAPTPQPFLPAASKSSADALSTTTISPSELTVSTEVTITFAMI